jgi:hypothetical protein
MGTFGLCSTELAGNVKHCCIPDQYGRSWRHFVYAKFVIFENFGLDGIYSVCLRQIDLHNLPFGF